MILLDCWNATTQVFQERQPEYIQGPGNTVINSSSFLFPEEFRFVFINSLYLFFKGLVKFMRKVVFLGAGFICFFSL